MVQGTSPVVRTVAGWLLALVLTAAAAVATAFVVNNTVYGPDHEVRAYFRALSDGDGGRALGLLNASVPDSNPALLDGDALAASVEGLEVLGIGPEEAAGGDRVSVPVRYVLDGTEHTVSYELESTGRRWLFFDSWTFVPAPLPTVEVAAPTLGSATLNGTTVSLTDGAGSFAAFYPGKVTAAFDSTYFAASEQQAVVGTATDGVSLKLDPQPTAELIDAVDTSIRGFLDSCADEDRLAPPGCPFYHFTDNRVEQPITWEITEYPQTSLSLLDDGWVLAPLNGLARLSAVEVDLFSGARLPLDAEEEFSFSANVSLTDTGVSVTPVVD